MLNSVASSPLDSAPSPPAIIGARVFLSPIHVGMIVDIGLDFPDHMRQTLRSYGDAIWHWRDRPDGTTTRALNIYSGEERG